ncbi:MAG: hypothetical protein HN909_02235 [Phycisphaerales bacterium]|nr:hypothetical protein [Phycisphaerales bacterium]MBT7170569.1 hypothetical protein [Phycisphaerales bacterium]
MKLALTIQHKNLEWSFSCSNSDYTGHSNGAYGITPHYHFQMRIDKKPFIKYKDFHVPFSEEDIFKFYMLDNHSDIFANNFLYGEGIQELFENIEPEDLVRYSKPTNKNEESTIHFSTIVTGNDGQTFRGEDIANLIEEAKEKNVPISSLAHKLGGSVMINVTPGPKVPEPAERKGGRGSKSKKKKS